MANKINKKDIGKYLEQWAKEYSVYVPTSEKDTTEMKKWDGKDTSFLDWYRNTRIPAKNIFFPLIEEMFHYAKDKEGYHLETPGPVNDKKLVFGIRPCDAAALALLDIAFKEGYEDPYYLEKRQNAILVGLACTKPYDTCFCTSLDSSPADSKNVDIMLTDTGDYYFVEAVTDKGKALLAKTSGLETANEADQAKAVASVEAACQKVTRQVKAKEAVKKLQANFEDKEYWEEISTKCVSCGICTFLCPTCFCFDIIDETEKGKSKRVRCWDSCQFSTYTRMPMENPREEKWRRVRQKVCHKYAFFPMSYDNKIACTGCGRCIRLCPVNWDITQVLNNIPEKELVEKK
ncbi:MAG: 4Fe-4S dicluster domain-containing protein [Dehalococcoidales bacterium]|nr:4Fe-4S dicluster domain-containing protein [Dehalococcoidales bacterium]